MKIKITIAVIILLQVILQPGVAQNNELKFNLIEGPNGKPLGKIRNIVQDIHGYMWFSGEDEKCIYRYDGARFTVFRHDDANPNSLGGTNINSVYADDSGMIWMGMQYGLDKFNPVTGVFKHYRHVPNDASSLVINNIAPILKDRQGRIWAGGSDGLDCLDEKTGKFTHYRNEPGNKKSLSSNFVWCIYEDRHGIIWIGTGNPWMGTDDGNGGLNRLEADNSFTRYMHDPKDPYSLINNKVGAIFEDGRGVFWIGTSGDGLQTMDRKRGIFERHLYDPKKPGLLSRPPLKPGCGFFDKINFITEDSTGAIWIGTECSGINRYDPTTKKITYFKNSNGFPDSSGWNAFTSRDGEVWITTEDRKLYRTDPFFKPIRSIPTENLADHFLEDREGYLWVSSAGNGLLKFDHNKKLVQHFKHDPLDSFSLLDNNTGHLFDNQDNTMLVTSYNGIRLFNKVTQRFSRFNTSEVFKDSLDTGFSGILRDNQGIMWFNRWGLGLIRYDPKDNSTRQFFTNADDSTSIGSNFQNWILQDRSGAIWLAGIGGINRLTPETGRFKHYMAGRFITYLYIDSGNNLWAGTDKGLYRYNQKEDSFKIFLDPQAEINSWPVGGIIEDDTKNLWLTSPSAIINLNPFTKETFIYGSRFGVSPNTLYPYTQAYKNKKGEIYIGYENGFYTFFPQELTVKSDLKIMITDFFINSIHALPGKESPLKKSIDDITDLALKYDQNNLSLNFAAIDYRQPESIKYFTMLEGYDNTWRAAVGEKSAYYFYVPPNKYVFHVKAYNSEGAKTERIITIQIHPPWWNTWLFRIGAAVCLIGLLYGLIRWRLQQKFRMQLERSDKEKQLVEFEMQALRAQMNPHFIFNSLNSINRFILQNNKTQASEYLTKFSKLVRMILQNSQASLITLENELEALEFYLDLEALRFDHHFDYKISVTKDMDVDILKVPPLIIQPYAENAIWHGLMHKEEKGHLDIEVIQEEDILYFKITDDGIGRKQCCSN